MDDKIINELDNLDVNDADQLLNSVEASDFGEEIDKKTMNRIKTSVLKKAGIDKELSKPLIPNKLKLLGGCLAITVIELLFFTSSAFIAWMDGFLNNLGINLSFGGVVPLVLYGIMFGFMSLAIYLAMYNMDSDTISLNKLLPKNGTSVAYLTYFIFSAGLKVFVFLALMFIMQGIVDFLSYGIGLYPDPPLIIFIALSSFVITFAVLDMFVSQLKKWIIMRYEGIGPTHYKWHIDIKSFLLELLKYGGIAGIIIAWTLLSLAGNNGIVSLSIGIAVLWILNTFLTVVVLLKKRHYHQMKISTSYAANNTEPTNKTAEINVSNRWIYLKQRAVVCGVLIVTVVYVSCLTLPYIVHSAMSSGKPSLVAFESKDEVSDFFTLRKLPFFANSSSSTYVSDLTETLFMINKMVIGAVNLKASTLFGGGSMNSIDAVQSNNLSDSVNIGRAKADDHSDTNTQVENVDEADVIKTDGRFVYYLNQSKLFIVKAGPPEKMEIIYQHDFSKEGLIPAELFLYKQHIAVILTHDRANNGKISYDVDTVKTVVRTYNIEDPANPIEERSLKLDYSYLTSRMVENNLYLVTTSMLDYPHEIKSLPGYIDSATSSSIVEMDYSNIYLMRRDTSNNYRRMNVVTAFPVDDLHGKAQVKAYIGGGGENVYVSTEHIYIVESASNATIDAPMEDFINNLVMDNYGSLDYQKYGTNIYRIKIKDGTVGGFHSAFVSGKVHNQFSMDEYNGYFRLTTQTGRWRYASSNVYVLDENMELCGKLEGLAPEESIYASRFMGDRLYLVTFKQVDPLFVISLKDPQNPTVLGELKIPGFSEYIHPLDENHIIGFGKDTAGGNENFSWHQGIKMAIFDISDVKNPKEKFVEIIGDRGTDSELLRNHKALMYMGNLGLMAFPVTLAETDENAPDHTYGDIVFQGAYVYNVSSDDGFKLRGRITHLDSQSEITVTSVHEGTVRDFINRIIYANESLYTFSGEKVKATRYSDMKDVSEISLK